MRRSLRSCPHCGHQTPSPGDYCPVCSSFMREEDRRRFTPPSSARKRIPRFLFAAFWILLAVLVGKLLM
ncbi:MAG TPA: hypothetical protein PK876_05550 [Elusimicrobiota bacterium]|nr:hypothetical protein [Elusimicrobiota bacterium]